MLKFYNKHTGSGFSLPDITTVIESRLNGKRKFFSSFKKDMSSTTIWIETRLPSCHSKLLYYNNNESFIFIKAIESFYLRIEKRTTTICQMCNITLCKNLFRVISCKIIFYLNVILCFFEKMYLYANTITYSLRS